MIGIGTLLRWREIGLELQIQHGQGTICNEGAGWEPEVRKITKRKYQGKQDSI